MELNDFRRILLNSRIDVWEFIDAAITVASSDYGDEFKARRDGIVEHLYMQSSSGCRNCTSGVDQTHNGFRSDKVLTEIDRQASPVQQKRGSHSTTESIHSHEGDDVEERNPYAALFDDYEDEETKIVKIREQIDDPDQSEDSLVSSLQTLADMDITFNALKVTDIGRHVNALRKHPSNKVRALVKQLVRKWKDLVDEWVNRGNAGSDSNVLAYGDSPQQKAASKNFQNGHHQVPDFSSSPNLCNGSSSGSDKNNSPFEQKAKSIPQPKPIQHKQPAPAPNRQQKEKELSFDVDRLASARKRLQENYQEANNAKKQRTIQMMDIHEIPKPKNAFFAKNRSGPTGRYHR